MQNLTLICFSKNQSLVFATRHGNTHILSELQLPHNWC